jgi:membrane associated rhomboid family serine protease
MRTRGASWLLAWLAAGFAVELLCGATGDPVALYALGALPDAGSLQREWWRLLSYAFLHWGWNHFLANVALLAWVAPMLERRVGALRLWALFLVAAVASGFAIACKHAWWPAPGVTVGASGGAFALLAAATLILWREPGSPRRARIGLALVVAGGALVSLWPGVSLLGHAVGGAIGAAFAALQSPRTSSPVSTLRVEAAADASEVQLRMPSK